MRHIRRVSWLLATPLVGVSLALGTSGCSRDNIGRRAPPDRTCHLHFEELGGAIVRYRREHGELPQTFVSREGYKHSWRLVLAPTLCAHRDTPPPLCSGYRFDKPWDSRENRRVVCLSAVACNLTCPLESRDVFYPYITDVMLVRGKTKDAKAGSSGSAPLSSDAVLIVESTNCGIEFGEPRDLNWDDLWKGESPFGKGKLNSLHPDFVRAIRVDGTVIDIPKNISRDRLRALLEGKLYPVASDDATLVSAAIILGVFGALAAWWAWRPRVRRRASKAENAGSG